jgi:hypothetical protein
MPRQAASDTPGIFTRYIGVSLWEHVRLAVAGATARCFPENDQNDSRMNSATSEGVHRAWTTLDQGRQIMWKGVSGSLMGPLERV